MEKNESKTSHRLVSENIENGNPKTTTIVLEGIQKILEGIQDESLFGLAI